MANVKLPLMSASAKGSIGDVLTFQERTGRHKVRYQRKQKDSNTSDQSFRRYFIIQGNIAWKLLSQSEKDAFNDRAKGHPMSGFNLFMSEYIKDFSSPESRSNFGQRNYGFYEFGRSAI